MRTEIEEVRVGDLIPYARNPRRNDAAVEAVKRSLEEFEYVSRIVAERDMAEDLRREGCIPCDRPRASF